MQSGRVVQQARDLLAGKVEAAHDPWHQLQAIWHRMCAISRGGSAIVAFLEDQAALETGVMTFIRERSRCVDVATAQDVIEALALWATEDRHRAGSDPVSPRASLHASRNSRGARTPHKSSQLCSRAHPSTAVPLDSLCRRSAWLSAALPRPV